MIHEYKGSIQGKPHEGLALYGYNNKQGIFQSAWVDSFHNSTSILLSLGKIVAGVYSGLGNYESNEGSPPWGWRTEIRMDTSDSIVISMFNITPDGKETLAVETKYGRNN